MFFLSFAPKLRHDGESFLPTTFSPSSVQYAISMLLGRQLLTYQTEERTKVYSIADRFLEMWICRTY